MLVTPVSDRRASDRRTETPYLYDELQVSNVRSFRDNELEDGLCAFDRGEDPRATCQCLHNHAPLGDDALQRVSPPARICRPSSPTTGSAGQM